ncbi:reverse transcriptase domain-containing protein [Tanacetum coccineum]
MHHEKVQHDKLKAVKARLHFGDCSKRNLRTHDESQYSESKTPTTKEEPIRKAKAHALSQPTTDRMPSHIKTYDGSEDPEDYLKIFQAAAKTERWAMPTWCHMFNSTLTGNARVWFDDLPPEPIDSYDDLKKAFLENYLQQKKYKLECKDAKGAPECMKISRFMHGITNPELIKRLHDKIPKSVDEMMKVTTTFLKGEVVASNHERKKSFLSWKHQEAGHKQNIKKEGFRNQQRSEQKQDRRTFLTKTPKEILALDKGKFKPPLPMTTPVEKRNANKFYEFQGEVGHTTDECMHLKRQIEEILKAGKLGNIEDALEKLQANIDAVSYVLPPPSEEQVAEQKGPFTKESIQIKPGHGEHRMKLGDWKRKFMSKPSIETKVIVQRKRLTKTMKEHGSGEKGEMEISTASPPKVTKVSTTEAHVYTRRKAKDKGKAIMVEPATPKKVKKRTQDALKRKEYDKKYLKKTNEVIRKVLKCMSYNDISTPIFERVWDHVNTFIPIGSEVEKGSSKPSKRETSKTVEEEKVEKEDVKPDPVMSKKKVVGTRRKTLARRRASDKQVEDSSRTIKKEKESDDFEQEKEDLRMWLSVLNDEEESMTPEFLFVRYPIVNWEGIKSLFRRLDRDDLKDLYKLVQERFEDHSLEEKELILWGDLRMMFDPDEQDEIWKNQES